MKVRELMTTEVVSVGPDDPIKEAARLMVESGVSGIPVVDDDGRLVGIITEADFVAGEAGRRAEQRAGLLRFLLNRQVIGDEELTVADVMTRDVITIGPDDDHTEAARRMEREGVKRLVVTQDEQVQGIVSRADIMRAFTRSDEAIVAEIKEHVMRNILWVDPDLVEVTSTDGNVVLDGRLPNRSDANLLVELTRRVDGVASVTDHLQWEYDDSKGDFTSPPPEMPRPNW
jgi:CBS domain-containing protein